METLFAILGFVVILVICGIALDAGRMIDKTIASTKKPPSAG